MRYSRSYRSSWSSDFSREPLDVYATKEDRRQVDMAQGDGGDGLPAIPRSSGIEGFFQREVGNLQSRLPAIPRTSSQSRGGGGLLGKIKDVAGGVGDILGNVGDVAEAANDALPSPVRNALSLIRDTNLPEMGIRTANDIVHKRNPIPRRLSQAARVATDAMSGEKFLGEFGVDTSQLPDGRLPLRQIVDVAAAPATILSAGAGGIAQAGGRGLTGSILRQFGKETASGVVGTLAAQGIDRRLPEDTPGVVRAAVGLGTGILAGGATYKALDKPGTIGRALRAPGEALATAQGRRGLNPIMGLQTEDVTGGKPLMREDLARLPHAQVTERPDLFQARDVPEGMTTDPRRVRNIVENYDPNKLESGLVVHDTSTDQYVVLRGHHRLEAQRQLSEAGRVGPEGTWQIIDADLSNPEHVAQLKDLAITSNYGTAATNIREDVRAYKGLKGIGQDNQTIEGKLRKTQQEVQDLEHLSTLPEDLLDRVNQSPASAGNAAEIAGAVKRYDLTETDLRALMGRYGPEAPKAGLSRTELRRRLEQVGRVLQEENAAKAQTGFGDLLGGEAGASWDATKSHVIDLIDQMADHESNLSSQRLRLRRLDNQLKDLADDPEIAAEVAQVRGRVQGKITELEAQLEQARNDYANARKARLEGNDVGPGTRSGVPESNGNGGAANPGTQGAEAPAGPVTRTTEPPPVGARIRVNGVEGEVTATSPEGVRVKVDGGGEQWFAAGKDMFGTETVFEILPTNPKMDLGVTRENGGTKPPPTNQERMPDTTPTPEPPTPAPQRIPNMGDRMKTVFGTDVPPEEVQRGIERGGIQLLRRSDAPREIVPATATDPELRIYRIPGSGVIEVSMAQGVRNPSYISQLYIAPAERGGSTLARLLRSVERDVPDVMIDINSLSPQMADLLTKHPRFQNRLFGRDPENPLRWAPYDQSLEAKQLEGAARPNEGQSAPIPESAPAPTPVQSEPIASQSGDRIAIPDAGSKPLGQLRTEAPAGYQLEVPADGSDPFYRRIQSPENMTVQANHPAPPPMSAADAKARFKDLQSDEISDEFQSLAARYHPNLSMPTDTLSADYAAIRKQAGRAYEREFLKDSLDGMGVDNIKELDPQLRSAVRKDARVRAEEAVRADERAVLGEEFHPFVDSRSGTGTTQMESVDSARTPDAALGEPPAQPSGTPDLPPAEPPGPKEPGPGNRQRGFGQDGQPVDLLLGKERDATISEATSQLQGRGQRVLSKVKGAADAAIRAVRNEKNRTDHIIRDTVGQQVDAIRARAERAGLHVVPSEDGNRWVLQGTDVAIEDVAEGATAEARAVRDALTPEQVSVLDDVRALNERWNQTIEAHGGEVPKVDTETGDYWSRKVTGRQVEGRVVDKNAPQGGSRRLGGNRFNKRTQASVAAGTEQGVVYENPWDALKAGMRSKGRVAQDAYLAKMIEPLAVQGAKPGFGHATLPGHPALAKTRVIPAAEEGKAAMMVSDPLVFTEEHAKQLRDILEGGGFGETKPGRAIAAVNSVLTPIRASTDVSFLLNQGMALLESSPRNAIKGLRGSSRVIRSAMGNADQYHTLLDGEVARGTRALEQAGVKQDALEWLTQRGLHYADEGAVNELQFPTGFSNAVGKVPLVGRGLEATTKWSNETFGRYLNYARTVLATDALERATAKGLTGAELDAEMASAIKSINRMSGWTGTRPSGIENALMFAPRFFRSNIEQTAAAFTKGGLEGSMARAHLAKLLGTAAGITVAVNEMRGYNTDIDPRSHNFLRIRNVFGQDVSLLGPYATLLRGVARAVGGESGQASGEPRGHGFVFGTSGISPDVTELFGFARAKASPVAGDVINFATGKTFDQRPIERDPLSPEFYTKTLPDMARENVPFSVQALTENGVGGAVVSATGAQGTAMTPAEKRDMERQRIAQEKFGSNYRDLSGGDKATVNQDPGIMDLQKEVDRRGLESDGATQTRIKADNAFRDSMSASAKFLAAGKDSAGNTFTGKDYRAAYNDAVQRRLGAMNTIDAAGGDADVRGYFDLYKQADKGNGQTDFDKLDRLQAEYIASHPGIEAKVDKLIGARDDPTLAEFRKAQKQAGAYYDIPAYKGLSVEDGNRANDIISAANALTSNGYAPNRATALKMMVDQGTITADERLLAIKAASAGSNPARRAFRVAPENALYRKYYGGVTADQAEQLPTFATTRRSGSSRGSSRSGGIRTSIRTKV